jgi:hypothetical protein
MKPPEIGGSMNIDGDGGQGPGAAVRDGGPVPTTCRLADQPVEPGPERRPAKESENEGDEHTLDKADLLHGNHPVNAAATYQSK